MEQLQDRDYYPVLAFRIYAKSSHTEQYYCLHEKSYNRTIKERSRYTLNTYRGGWCYFSSSDAYSKWYSASMSSRHSPHTQCVYPTIGSIWKFPVSGDILCRIKIDENYISTLCNHTYVSTSFHDRNRRNHDLNVHSMYNHYNAKKCCHWIHAVQE